GAVVGAADVPGGGVLSVATRRSAAVEGQAGGRPAVRGVVDRPPGVAGVAVREPAAAIAHRDAAVLIGPGADASGDRADDERVEVDVRLARVSALDPSMPDRDGVGARE